MASLLTQIKVRKDTYESIQNLVLAQGEPGFAHDTGDYAVGDGTKKFSDICFKLHEGVINNGTSTDKAIARFDGTTGRIIQDSTAIISDDGHLSINTTSDTTMTTPAIKVLHTGPVNGTSYADLMELAGYNSAPYGFKFRTYGDGTAIIQSQRIRGGTEKFPLSLNPDGGDVFIGGKVIQGTKNTDTTITNMNQFTSDLYVKGDGSAPNSPRVAGFYLGKSAGTDENRHMDIVTGSTVSYIDFNRAGVERDYDFRFRVNNDSGNVLMQWNSGYSASAKLFKVEGGTLEAATIKKTGGADTHVLLAGGGTKAVDDFQPAGDYLTEESDTLQTVTDRGANTTQAIGVAGLTSTGNVVLHNPGSGDSPKLVFQRGDETGTVTDWNMYVQSGVLKLNSIPTSGSTIEKTIAEFGYHGGITFNSITDTSGAETASLTVKTSNGGQIIIGKQGQNNGTMLRFDQAAGVTRLRFRSSSTAGAMVWEQPETAARLYFDFGNAAGNGVNRVNMPNPEGGGTLALLSDIKGGTVTSVGVNSTSLTVTGSPITSSGTITIEHPTTTATTADIYKIGKDSLGHVVIGDKVAPADLGLSTVYKYKGTKTWAELKALTSAEIGDVYSITDKDPDGNTNADWACYTAVTAATGDNYANYWQSLGGKVDLSNYITGSGAVSYIPKFTGTRALGSSVISQAASNKTTIGGKLVVDAGADTSQGNCDEGIRILPQNGWSEVFFSNNTSITGAGGWIVARRGSAGTTSGAIGDFTIEYGSWQGTGLTLYADGSRPRWNNSELAYLSDFGTGGSMDLGNYVTLATAQTISGIKTFTAQPVINTVDGLKFTSGNCSLRIYNTSATPTDYAAIEVRSNSTSTNRNLFIDLANNSLVVGPVSGTANTTYKVNVVGSLNATTIYENSTLLSNKYAAKDHSHDGTYLKEEADTLQTVTDRGATTTQTITALAYSVDSKSTIQYNTTEGCLEFIFA